MTIKSLHQRKSLHNDTKEQRSILSLPFSFQFSTVMDEKCCELYVDLSFPSSSAIAGSEIKTLILSRNYKSCIVHAQLLDNSGRVSSSPFVLGTFTERSDTLNVSFPLQESQKLRLIFHVNDNGEVPLVTIVGKIFLASGGVTPGKNLKKRISQWNLKTYTFSPYLRS